MSRSEVDSLKMLHHSIGDLIEQKDPLNQPVRRFALPGGGGVSKGLDQPGVKVHHGAQGEVYEVKAGTKLADAMPGSKADAEVPLDRWLAATMLGEKCEDKAALEFARESSKGLSGGSTGTLIPTEFQGQWIDNLRSFMVLEACGMSTATMSARTVSSSRIVSDPAVAWRAEGGALTPSDPTFELRNLVANTLSVRVQATAELAQDSPDFGSQLMNVMGRSLALEIDRAGLIGTGTSNQPRGILNTAGINTRNVGGPINPNHLVMGVQGLLENNVPLELAEKNAVMSPRTWGALETMQSADGQPLARPRALEKMAYRPTTSIPNNLGSGSNKSVVIQGDFSELVLGVRMETSIEALRLTSFATNLQLEFIGWTRVDFMIRRPASFLVSENIPAIA